MYITHMSKNHRSYVTEELAEVPFQRRLCLKLDGLSMRWY